MRSFSWGLPIFVWFGLAGLPDAGAAETAPAKHKIAVLDLKDSGIGPEAASLLTGIVCNRLSSFGVFEVISREDIKNLLTHEQDRMLLGCSNDECLVKIGGVLGAENLVAGSVGMVGKKYVINVQLLDVRQAKVQKRVERQFEGTRERLLEEIGNAAHMVVEDILKAEGGTLLFSVSEESSDISVDGRIAGTSPLGNLAVPAGPHDIRVVKDGFIDWSRTIQMRPKEVQLLEVTQIPSVKFIENYETQAKKTRRWAWIAAAACAALEVGALSLRAYTWQKYDPIEDKYNSMSAGVERTAYYNTHKGDMQTAEIMDYTGLSMSIVGILAGVGSLYLFLEGDNPSRYDRFRGIKSDEPSKKEESAPPSAGVSLTGLGFSF
jgi:hypothetical protein